MQGIDSLKGQNQFNRVSLVDTFARRRAREKLRPDLIVPVQHCRYVRGRRKLTPEQRAKRDLVRIGIVSSVGAAATLVAWLLGADKGLMFLVLCYAVLLIVLGFFLHDKMGPEYTDSW